jgi:hypothetical protein
MTLIFLGSLAARNGQTVALTSVIFEKQVSDELKNLLEELNNGEALGDRYSVDNGCHIFIADNIKYKGYLESDYDRAVVRDAQRDYDFTAKLPKSLAMEEAEVVINRNLIISASIRLL